MHAFRAFTLIELSIAVCCGFPADLIGAEIQSVQMAISPADVHSIRGFVGERLQANDRYLLLFDVDRFVKMVEEKQHTDWWWIGEQPGKWLESAIWSARHSGNSALREKARFVLSRLLAAQDPDGYLGITSPKVRTTRQPIRGMDPYELYFTLHALLTAYEEWGDGDALDAAKRLGDFFVDKIGPNKAEFWPLPNPVTIAGHHVHYSLEGTLLIDPMSRLAQLAGNSAYLNWSQWALANIDRWSNCDSFSNLDHVATGTMGIHEIQPYVHCHTLHMNMLGMLQIYQATGDESLLRKVEGAWNDINKRQVYITGGVSVGEHYTPDHELPNTDSIVETCAGMSWLSLNQQLLEITGESRYADAIERLFWNHLFAMQSVDGDGFCYHTPLNGWKPDHYFTGPDCCSASGARILSFVPQFIYARRSDGVAVNQYVASAAEFTLDSGAALQLEMNTNYPESEEVSIAIRLEKKSSFSLYLRIPSWCASPQLKINGKTMRHVQTGMYAVLKREWKNNDRVRLVLPMTPQWNDGQHGNVGSVCLTRGPLVYVLDTVWCEAAARDALLRGDGQMLPGLAGIPIESNDSTAAFQTRPTPPRALGPAYECGIQQMDGTSIRVLMVPFANLGKWYRESSAPSERKRHRESYGVWLPRSVSGEFKPIDIRASVNVHSNAGRGLFLNASELSEQFPFPHYGRYNLRGIPFDTIDPAVNDGKNLLILCGGPEGAVAGSYPDRVRIPIGQKAVAIHVLGAVGGWAYPYSTDRHCALRIDLHYADESVKRVEWRNGVEIADYNGHAAVPGSQEGIRFDSTQLRQIRIPTEDTVAIESIEFEDTGTIVAPVVAALTLECPADKKE